MTRSGKRLAAISVDLDPVRCYYEIHGLPAPPPPLGDLVIRRAAPRFEKLFAQRGIVATFFVVGADLSSAACRDAVSELARAGHEIGNHSQQHLYDLQRRDDATLHDEVATAHARISELTGRSPVGFRAPGYGLGPRLLAVLESHGYRYDSSVFPSGPYYAAKLAVMSARALGGEPSGAFVGDPRGLLAPADPYRPRSGAPWRRGQSSVVELPVAVTPSLRLPAIGTLLVTAPQAIRARVLESMRKREFFNLELHGIDLCDAEADGLPTDLVARQPDLRRPLKDKVRTLAATLERLSAEYDFVPLAEVALRFQREGHV